MKTDTSKKILQYIAESKKVSPKELTERLGISRQALFKHHLSGLIKNGKIKKIGRPPKVYYVLAKQLDIKKVKKPNVRISNFIDKHYLYVTPSGNRLPGWDGFLAWCDKTKKNPTKTSHEYITALKKYLRFRKNGLLNGMPKMKQTFPKVFLDQLYYLDFYSIEHFGKTKLGQLLLYAKQSQNKALMQELVEQVRPQILTTAQKLKIDGVLFIPPTVKREVQLMKELERALRLPIKSLKVSKIKTPISVPQKTLSKLEDRVENAQQTIVVEEKGVYNNILLIDDAVGSGATLNETAKQIKEKGICKKKAVGLAITGSFKGFDIISEV